MTSFHTHYVRIDNQGFAVFPHIDFESNPITVWHETDEFIVFKLPAGKHWESVLNPSVSHPGRYMVCQKEDEQPWKAGKRRLRVRQLFDMPLRTSNRGRNAP